MKAQAAAFEVEPFRYPPVRALMDDLGLSEPVAITLVRRGIDTVEAARSFLDASDEHDPLALKDMEAACGLIEAAIAEGRPITVHGDYDVDGVCSTSILVSALRDLGADCDWLIPDRGEGYGLSIATVERLAAAGRGLLLTVDCGITAAVEVARAQELGMKVVVTDHHEPPAVLPDCPVVHPALGDYPFDALCGTGVAWKLACALRRRAGRDAIEDEADLDLVALATVADMVPLRGENRALVRRGLAVARRASRPGLRALLAVAACEPAELDEGSLSFRVAPRINAAGRLYRADAGVELMLTSDDDRAAAIASELHQANSERKTTELEVVGAAESAVRALEPRLREAPVLVVAGEGWHPGVIGIVASRLVEAHGRPAIVISLDADGNGRGSGRSLAPLDLVAALGACSAHLERHGGHKAAAGLEIRSENVDAFRAALVDHAQEVLNGSGFERGERVDAVVGGDGLGLELAEELGRLAPFGVGNPEVRLLVPAATLRDVRPLGQEGDHVRFAIASGKTRAKGVGFRTGPTLPVGPEELCDVSVRLDANRWNGSVEPQAVLRSIRPLEPHPPQPEQEVGCVTADVGAGWWGRVEAERVRDLADEGPSEIAAPGTRSVIERGPRSVVAVVAGLASSGASVLAVVADCSRRQALVERVGLERFGASRPLILCGHCSRDALAAGEDPATRLAITDWAALRRCPTLPAAFEHVVLVDPVPENGLQDGLTAGEGYLHRCYGPSEVEFSRLVLEWDWATRAPLRALYAAIRAQAGELAGDALSAALRGPGRHPRTPEQAGRLVRVLDEAGICRVECVAAAPRVCLLTEAGGVELERSAAYLGYEARLQEGLRYLTETT